MFGTAGIGGDEWKIDIRRDSAGKLHLRLLRGLAQALKSHLVVFEINPRILLKLRTNMIDQNVIHIRSTEFIVSAGGYDLEGGRLMSLIPSHLKDRHIESPAAEIKDHDLLFLAGLVQSVRQTRRGRLIDDPKHLQTRNLAGIFGGLPLVVIEISGDRDHGLINGFAKIFLGIRLDLLKDEGADLLRGEFLAADMIFVVRPHFPLGGIDRSFGIHRCLTAGRLPDQALSVFGERHKRRECLAGRNPCPFRRRDNRRTSSFHDRRG